MKATSGNPYVGLQAFDVDDSVRFFGRSNERAELVDLWQSNRLVVLYGPSGIGKSSLLRAGAVARLLAEGADVLPVGRVAPAARFPLPAVDQGNPHTFALLTTWSKFESPAKLASQSVSKFLLERPKPRDGFGDEIPIYAVIDQFEDVLTPRLSDQAAGFLTELSHAIKDVPSLRLLISIREDALAAFLPHEIEVAGHARARMRLGAMRSKAALEAITGPIGGTGRSFAPGAAEHIVRDLRTVEMTNRLGERRHAEVDEIEPWQLQVVCDAVWNQVPPTRNLIHAEDVRAVGGVAGALGVFYDRAVARVADDSGISGERLRHWLENEFVTEHGTRNSVYEGFIETAGMPNIVAHRFEEHRILRSERRSGANWFELQHDRLIEPICEATRTGAGPPEDEQPMADHSTVSAADYLREAETALADREFTLAERYAIEADRLAGESVDEGGLRIKAEATSFLGNVSYLQGDLEGAERYFRSAAELFEVLRAPSAVARLQAAIARLLVDQGRLADASVELSAAVSRLPGDVPIKLDLARTLWRAGELGGASGLFGEILVAAPDNADALAGRGQVLLQLGDHASALADLDRLIRLHPATLYQPEVRAGRALGLAGVGSLDEAIAEAEAAVEMETRNGPALLYAAAVFFMADDRERAGELLGRAVEASSPPLFASQFYYARALFGNL